MLAPWKKSYDKPRQHIKKQRYYFINKGLSSQSYGFSSSHVWMWELEYKESWALNNWCFWTVVLEKTLESPLKCSERKPVHPKGNQPWIFTGRTDAEAETPTLWPPDAKNWLIGKDLDAGKDWRQEKKGTTEDEMAGWHHRLNGHEFEKSPGVGDGQGSLACCSPWGRKESDTTVTELNWSLTVNVVEMESVIHLWNFLPYIKGQSCLLVLSRRYRCSNKEVGHCLWLNSVRNHEPKGTGVQQHSSRESCPVASDCYLGSTGQISNEDLKASWQSTHSDSWQIPGLDKTHLFQVE